MATLNQVELLASRYYEKTVGPLNKERSAGQVYLPEGEMGEPVVLLWCPMDVEVTDLSEDRLLVSATVEGWERTTAYQRGTGAGFVVGKDRVGDHVLVLPDPERLVVA